MTARVVIDHAAIRALLRSDEVASIVADCAQGIADQANADPIAGDQFTVVPGVGPNRARAAVWAGSVAARYAEAKFKTLTRAIDAGRK